MGKFNKGLFFGGLLGAFAMWMGTTKKGKALRSQIIDQSADLYEEVSKKILLSDAWKTMTKSQYVVLVEQAVDNFATNHPWAKKAQKTLKKMIISQWKRIEIDIEKKRKAFKK